MGADAINILHHAAVAVFGIGGVGSYAAEAFARAGIGSIDLLDDDKISKANINRQDIALSFDAVDTVSAYLVLVERAQ